MAGGNLSDAIEGVAGRLASVTVDGRPLRSFTEASACVPPCVWVPPPSTMRPQFNKRRSEVEWNVYLLAPVSGKLTNSSAHLAAMYDAVMEQAGLPITAATLEKLDPSSGAPTVYAYRLTWLAMIPIGEG